MARFPWSEGGLSCWDRRLHLGGHGDLVNWVRY